MRYALLAVSFAGALGAATLQAQMPSDPRVGLKGGWKNAAEAISNLTLIAHRDKPEGFFNASNLGDFGLLNADFAFRGNLLFLGGFNGLQVWDITTPSDPKLRYTVACPGGQGDVSVYQNLLFWSVEETRGRVDCGAQGVRDTVSADRFRGVRIYDISDVDHPRAVATVQTCRGSHTHTLVTDPKDPANVYIYVSGTAPSRSGNELAGCSALAPASDPNTPYFRIEVIKVPVTRPQEARVVNAPRIFADTAGNIAGLNKGGQQIVGGQFTSVTNQCHDITAYTQIGLAAGACAGNGILLDISDPANPKRIAEVTDPNFAYWHSATFNNDGTKVLFSDEWGGGVAPRCRATDRPEWGADAIFTIDANRRMHYGSYYKLPAAQTDLENCVAHNGSLIPVPGRDIMVQAWYQGGLSVFDFTDAAHPKEIAYFDRGPIDTALALAGYWSTYWYNGRIYGSEIGRGLDVFELKPSEFLSQNEIDAAKLVKTEYLNVQNQQKIVWPAAFVVARAYLDGLVRSDALRRPWATPIYAELSRAEKVQGSARRNALTALAARLDRDAAGSNDAARVRALAGVVRALAR